MTTATLQNNSYKQAMKQKTAKPMLWIGLVSIIMFFAGLTSAVVISMASNSWVNIEIPTLFVSSTIFILLSSLTYQFAFYKIKQSNLKIALFLVITTLLLGVAFSVSQFFAWKQLYASGVFWAGSESHQAGSYFYALTALHLLHLIGGLISLIVVIVKTAQQKYSSENVLGIQLSLTYWHFLTALWVYLFFFLKFIA